MNLSIPDMSCRHCREVVERTIVDLDSDADVVVDLETRTARVTTTLHPEAVRTALASNGYPATIIE